MKPDVARTRLAWQEFAGSGEFGASAVRKHVGDKHDLVEAAAPFLRALSVAAGNEPHAVILSDESGLVLQMVADDEPAWRTEGFPGAATVLAESLAGEDGQVVGAVCMYVRRVEAAERVHQILTCAARGIEAELIHRRLGREREEAREELGSTTPAIEALRQDVTQLQTAARLRFEQAAITTRNHIDDALAFVSLADQLIQRFRNQSVRWRDIAIAETGAPTSVDLQFRLFEIAELMATEAAIHGVRAKISNGPPVHVSADSRELSRSLFRCFLKSFETLKGGGEVRARVVHHPRRGVARVAFSGPQHLAVEFPLAAAPRVR